MKQKDKLRNISRSQSTTRDLSKPKSNIKLEALSRWKRGERIQRISTDLQISRETIYRWIKRSDEVLSKTLPKRTTAIDQTTKSRIWELYFLLKRPSMSALSQALQHHFSIEIPSFTLRRYLKKWGLGDYHPSALWEVILIEQGWRRVSSSDARDGQ